ncbi:MAG: hypothetical protein P1Q69_17135, partial [Candidatus Thorarchaeota archaeon]|nr:hypothetical protein [Candidatus Thorarchaeota archaeon]
GLLSMMGFKSDEYEFDLQLSETGRIDILANPIYRNIKESDIGSAEEKLQAAVEKIRKHYRESKKFQLL